jgi:P-type E1-E2 ATPase
MALRYEIPGANAIEVEHLLLDVNGTLTRGGELLDGVAERLRRLAGDLSVELLSADTRGSLERVAAALDANGTRVERGEEKAELVRERGPRRCAAIGNGANDAQMLATAAVGIAVAGPEGAASRALLAADIVCGSILEALDLLLDERSLASTLRP